MNDEQLTQRMRRASEAVEMSDAAQARHLEAISAALESAATAEADVIEFETGTTRRRRIVASVVAVAVMAPAGLAAASESSLPGDALYPIKQISERVLVLFDADVIAEHRIEEIEALGASGRVTDELYDDARAALTELGEDHPLWQRLADSSAPAVGGAGQEISDDDRSEVDSGTAAVELALPDGSVAKIALAGDELVEIVLPTGWTVTEMGDNDARLESDRYIVDVEVSSDGSVGLVVTEREADDDASDESPDSNAEASDDDESSEVETTSSTIADRADDSDSTETDSSDDERKDDDASASP